MTSPALSAQNSVFEIGSGTSAAKTVTAAVAGFPTIIAAAGHGFGNGTSVTLAGLAGVAGINAAFVAKNVTANTFAIDLNSTGDTLTASAATATPAAYTKVHGFNTFDGFDGEASEIETTDMDSQAVEVILGLVDNGKLSLGIFWNSGDAGQQALLAARDSGVVQGFRLTMPNGKVATFNGYVKSFPVSLGVNAAIKTTLGVRISGPVTWA